MIGQSCSDAAAAAERTRCSSSGPSSPSSPCPAHYCHAQQKDHQRRPTNRHLILSARIIVAAGIILIITIAINVSFSFSASSSAILVLHVTGHRIARLFGDHSHRRGWLPFVKYERHQHLQRCRLRVLDQPTCHAHDRRCCSASETWHPRP